MKGLIRVYNGPGTDANCVNWTVEAFRSVSQNPGLIITIDERTIRNYDAWAKDTSTLIIPGGAANPYHIYLGDVGMENIRKFVYSGKTIIGICAGAYFLSQKSNFAEGTKFEIKNNHIGLFEGEARGPFFKDFNYKDDTIKFPNVACIDNALRQVYVHGGGWFVEPEKYLNTSILAKYDSGEPAIIKIKNCGEGKGNILASHVHFEYPEFWNDWCYFILNALEHQEGLMYNDGQIINI